ncbi:hypothetical protein AB3N62_11245 [Leptospira sp. WS4.C2]
MNKVKINEGYELFQIITDFKDPLEIFREAFQNAIDEDATEVYCNIYEEKKLSSSNLIIDIWNNGKPLEKERISNFFDLANSSKIDKNMQPQLGKLGYKGHGSKIFFNSEFIEISSKTDDQSYNIQLEDPINQIENKGSISYSEPFSPNQDSPILPNAMRNGFFLRIKNHNYFNTQHTYYKLNHRKIRDYAKWFTVFGTIKTEFDSSLRNKNIKLYLRGIEFDGFKTEFSQANSLDPMPIYKIVSGVEFEEIDLGHYFPLNRHLTADMEAYANSIGSNKPYYNFYSRLIFKETISCSDGTVFNLILNVEGYETKRRYNALLSRRGRQRDNLSYTDSERYGIWACKGGIPVEKIDHWIEGGKGTYSFVHGFLDCDKFKLTANRGSIENTESEIIDIVRDKLNEIFKRPSIKDLLNERTDIETLENISASITEDNANLKKRFSDSKKRKVISLPNSQIQLFEPKKLTRGYSESETLVLLIQLITMYPKLFPFKILDYDTTKGIDFVVEQNANPKYIELKGSMQKTVNHPFSLIYKFICYEIDFRNNDIIEDIEEYKTQLQINRSDSFQSFDSNFKDKPYVSYQLVPQNASIQSMEIIELKSLLTTVLGATIQ